jgi:hypothetical protein
MPVSPDDLITLQNGMQVPIVPKARVSLANAPREVFGDASSISTYPNVTDIHDFTKYGVKVYPYVPLEEWRAKNQSRTEQFGNAMANVGNELVLGTLKGLTDIPKVAGDYISNRGLLDLAYSEARDDFFGSMYENVKANHPIYKEADEQGFRPNKFAWWAEGLPSAASTASFIIPGIAAAKAATYLSKGLGLLTRLGKTEKLIEGASLSEALFFGKQGTAVAATMAGALYGNAYETWMSIGQQLPKWREEIQSSEAYLSGKITREDMEAQLQERATALYKDNLPSAFLDMIGMYHILKPFGAIDSKVVTKFGQRAVTTLKAETLPEGIQEGINYFAEQKGQRNIDEFLGLRTNSDYTLGEFFDDENAWTNMVFGAVGGSLSMGIGRAVNQAGYNLSNSQRVYKGVGKALFTGLTTPEIKAAEEQKIVLDQLHAEATKLAKLKNLAELTGDQALYDSISKRLGTISALSHLENGTFEDYKAHVAKVGEVISGLESLTTKPDGTQLLTQVPEIKDKYNALVENLDRIKTKYNSAKQFYGIQSKEDVANFTLSTMDFDDQKAELSRMLAEQAKLFAQDEFGIFRTKKKKSLEELITARQELEAMLPAEHGDVERGIKNHMEHLENLINNYGSTTNDVQAETEIQIAKKSLQVANTRVYINDILSGKSAKERLESAALLLSDKPYWQFLYGQSGVEDSIDEELSKNKIVDILHSAINRVIESTDNINVPETLDKVQKEGITLTPENKQKLISKVQEETAALSAQRDELMLEAAKGFLSEEQIEDQLQGLTPEEILQNVSSAEHRRLSDEFNTKIKDLNKMSETIRELPLYNPKQKTQREIATKHFLDRIANDVRTLQDIIDTDNNNPQAVGQAIVFVMQLKKYLASESKYDIDKDAINKALEPLETLIEEAGNKIAALSKDQDKMQEVKYNSFITSLEQGINVVLKDFKFTTFKALDDAIAEIKAQKVTVSRKQQIAEIKELLKKLNLSIPNRTILKDFKDSPELLLYSLASAMTAGKGHTVLNSDESKYPETLSIDDIQWNPEGENYEEILAITAKVREIIAINTLNKLLNTKASFNKILSAQNALGDKLIPLYKEQTVSLYSFFINYQLGFDYLYLQGIAGTGKTRVFTGTIVKLLDKLGLVKPSEVLAMAKGKDVNNRLNQSIFNEAAKEDLLSGVISKDAIKASLVGKKLVILDEVGKLSSDEFDAVVAAIDEFNAGKKANEKVQVFMTGDPNQVTVSTNIPAVDGYRFNSTTTPRTAILPSLTIAQRTNNNNVISFQNRFLRSKTANAFSTPFTESFSPDQTQGVEISTSDAEFVSNINRSLSKFPNDTALIVESEAQKATYNIPGLPIYTVAESAGLDFKYVFIDLTTYSSINGTTSGYRKDNKKFYTAISRTINYVNLKWSTSNGIAEKPLYEDANAKKILEDKLAEREKEYKDFIAEQLSAYGVAVKPAAQAAANAQVIIEEDESGEVIADANINDAPPIVDEPPVNEDPLADADTQGTKDPVGSITNISPTYETTLTSKAGDTVISFRRRGTAPGFDDIVYFVQNKDTLLWEEIGLTRVPRVNGIFAAPYTKAYTPAEIDKFTTAGHVTEHTLTYSHPLEYKYDFQSAQNLDNTFFEKLKARFRDFFSTKNYVTTSIKTSMFVATNANIAKENATRGSRRMLLYNKKDPSSKGTMGVTVGATYMRVEGTGVNPTDATDTITQVQYIPLEPKKLTKESTDIKTLSTLMDRITALEPLLEELGYAYEYGQNGIVAAEINGKEKQLSEFTMFMEVLKLGSTSTTAVTTYSNVKETKELYEKISVAPNREAIIKAIEAVNELLQKVTRTSTEMSLTNMVPVKDSLNAHAILAGTGVGDVSKDASILSADLMDLIKRNGYIAVHRASTYGQPVEFRKTFEVMGTNKDGEEMVYHIKISIPLSKIEGVFSLKESTVPKIEIFEMKVADYAKNGAQRIRKGYKEDTTPNLVTGFTDLLSVLGLSGGIRNIIENTQDLEAGLLEAIEKGFPKKEPSEAQKALNRIARNNNRIYIDDQGHYRSLQREEVYHNHRGRSIYSVKALSLTGATTNLNNTYIDTPTGRKMLKDGAEINAPKGGSYGGDQFSVRELLQDMLSFDASGTSNVNKGFGLRETINDREVQLTQKDDSQLNVKEKEIKDKVMNQLVSHFVDIVDTEIEVSPPIAKSSSAPIVTPPPVDPAFEAKKADDLRRGDFVFFQLEKYQVEHVGQDSISMRNQMTGDLEEIRKEDYDGELVALGYTAETPLERIDKIADPNERYAALLELAASVDDPTLSNEIAKRIAEIRGADTSEDVDPLADFNGAEEMNSMHGVPKSHPLSSLEAIDMLRKLIPDITEDEIIIATKVITATNVAGVSESFKDALGLTYRGIIHLLEGTDGTIDAEVVRHEAFHKLLNQYVPIDVRVKLINALRNTPGIEAYKAEVGREVLSDADILNYGALNFQAYKDPTNPIAKFFNWLRVHILLPILAWLGRDNAIIEKVFIDLNNNKYTQRLLSNGETGADFLKMVNAYFPEATLLQSLKSYITSVGILKNLLVEYTHNDAAITFDPATGAYKNLNYLPVEAVDKIVKRLENEVMRGISKGINPLIAVAMTGEKNKERIKLNADRIRSSDKLTDAEKDILVAKMHMQSSSTVRALVTELQGQRSESVIRDLIRELDDTYDLEDEGLMIDSSSSLKDEIEQNINDDREAKITQKLKEYLSLIPADGKFLTFRYSYARMLTLLVNEIDITSDNIISQLEKLLKNTYTDHGTKYVITELLRIAKGKDNDRFNNTHDIPEGFSFEDGVFKYKWIEVKRSGAKNSTLEFYDRIIEALDKLGDKTSSDFLNTIGRDKLTLYNFIKHIETRGELQDVWGMLVTKIGSQAENIPVVDSLWYANRQEFNPGTGKNETIDQSTYFRAGKVPMSGIADTLSRTIRARVTGIITDAASTNSISDTVKRLRGMSYDDVLLELGVTKSILKEVPAAEIDGIKTNIKAIIDTIAGTVLTTKEDSTTTIETKLSAISSNVTAISKVLVKNNQFFSTLNYMDSANNRRYVFVMGSWVHYVLNKMTGKNPKLPEFLLEDNHISRNNIYNTRTNNGLSAIHNVVSLDGLTQTINRTPSEYPASKISNMTSAEFYQHRFLNSFLGMMLNKEKGLTYYQYTWQQSDRKSDLAAEVNVLSDSALRIAHQKLIDFNNDQLKAKTDGLFNRIKNFNKRVKKQWYNGITFEQFKERMLEKAATDFKSFLDETDYANTLWFNKVENYKQLNPAVERLSQEDYALINPDKLYHKYIEDTLKIELGENYTRDLGVYTNLFKVYQAFYMQNYVNGEFLNQLVFGDKDFTADEDNLVKRMNMIQSPAERQFVGKGGNKKTSKFVCAQDYTRTFGAATDFAKSFPKIENKKGTEISDGTTYGIEKTLQGLHKGTRNYHLGNIIKIMGGWIDANGKTNYIKTALFIIDDESAQNFPKYAEIRRQMETHGLNEDQLKRYNILYQKLLDGNISPKERYEYNILIDDAIEYYTFASAYKVGLPDKDFQVKNGEAIQDKHVGVWENKFIGIQSDPIHDDETISQTSQFDYFTNVNGLNEEEAFLLYKLNAELNRLNFSAYNIESSIINPDGTVDRKALAKEITKAASKSLSDERIFDLLANKVNVNFPVVEGRAIITTASIFEKNSVGVRHNGKKLVLQTAAQVRVYELNGKISTYRDLSSSDKKKAMLYEGLPYGVKEAISHVADLKAAGKTIIDGKEVSFADYLDINREAFADIYKLSEEDKQLYNEIIEGIIAGKSDFVIPRRLQMRNAQGYTEVIAPRWWARKLQAQYGDKWESVKHLYETGMAIRIPTTGIHSALAIRIIFTAGNSSEDSFSDSVTTNRIIAPEELVELHGSDFDVDALFAMFREVATSRELGNEKSIKVGEYTITEDTVVGYDENGNFIPELGGVFMGVIATTREPEKKKALTQLYSKYKKNIKVDNNLGIITDPKNAHDMNMPIAFGPLKDDPFDGLLLENAGDDVQKFIVDTLTKYIANSSEDIQALFPKDLTTVVDLEAFKKGKLVISPKLKSILLKSDIGLIAKLKIISEKQNLKQDKDINGFKTQMTYHRDNHMGKMGVGIQANLMKAIAYLMYGGKFILDGENIPLDTIDDIRIEGDVTGIVLKDGTKKFGKLTRPSVKLIKNSSSTISTVLLNGKEFSREGYKDLERQSDGTYNVIYEDGTILNGVLTKGKDVNISSTAVEFKYQIGDTVYTYDSLERETKHKKHSTFANGDTRINGYIDNVKVGSTPIVNATTVTIDVIGLMDFTGWEFDSVGYFMNQPAMHLLSSSRMKYNKNKVILLGNDKIAGILPQKYKELSGTEYKLSVLKDVVLKEESLIDTLGKFYGMTIEDMLSDPRLTLQDVINQLKVLEIFTGYKTISKSLFKISSVLSLLRTIPTKYEKMITVDRNIDAVEHEEYDFASPNFIHIPHIAEAVNSFKSMQSTVKALLPLTTDEVTDALSEVRTNTQFSTKSNYGTFSASNTLSVLRETFRSFMMAKVVEYFSGKGFSSVYDGYVGIDMATGTPVTIDETETDKIKPEKFIATISDGADGKKKKVYRKFTEIVPATKEEIWVEMFLKDLSAKMKGSDNPFLSQIIIDKDATTGMHKLRFNRGTGVDLLLDAQIKMGFLMLDQQTQEAFVYYAMQVEGAGFGFSKYTSYIPALGSYDSLLLNNMNVINDTYMSQVIRQLFIPSKDAALEEIRLKKLSNIMEQFEFELMRTSEGEIKPPYKVLGKNAPSYSDNALKVFNKEKDTTNYLAIETKLDSPRWIINNKFVWLKIEDKVNVEQPKEKNAEPKETIYHLYKRIARINPGSLLKYNSTYENFSLIAELSNDREFIEFSPQQLLELEKTGAVEIIGTQRRKALSLPREIQNKLITLRPGDTQLYLNTFVDYEELNESTVASQEFNKEGASEFVDKKVKSYRYNVIYQYSKEPLKYQEAKVNTVASIEDMEAVKRIADGLSKRFKVEVVPVYSEETWSGKVFKGKVYLNMNRVTKDTPFHEIGHIFMAHLKRTNPKFYQSLIEELKSTEEGLTLIQATRSKVRYANLTEDALMEEAVVQFIGMKASELPAKSRLQRMLFAITEFISKMLKALTGRSINQYSPIETTARRIAYGSLDLSSENSGTKYQDLFDGDVTTDDTSVVYTNSKTGDKTFRASFIAEQFDPYIGKAKQRISYTERAEADFTREGLGKTDVYYRKLASGQVYGKGFTFDGWVKQLEREDEMPRLRGKAVHFLFAFLRTGEDEWGKQFEEYAAKAELSPEEIEAYKLMYAKYAAAFPENTFQEMHIEKTITSLLPEFKLIGEDKTEITGQGISGTPDVVLDHGANVYSVLDFKTGDSALSSGVGAKMRYAKKAGVNMVFSSADKNLLKLALNVVQIRLKDPQATFRAINLVHLNLEHGYNSFPAQIAPAMKLLEEYFKENHAEFYATHKEAFNIKTLREGTINQEYGKAKEVNPQLSKEQFTINKRQVLQGELRLAIARLAGAKTGLQIGDKAEDIEKIAQSSDIEKEATKRIVMLVGELSELDNGYNAIKEGHTQELDLFSANMTTLYHKSNPLIVYIREMYFTGKMQAELEARAFKDKSDDLLMKLIAEKGQPTGNYYDFYEFLWDANENGEFYTTTWMSDKYAALTQAEKDYVNFYRWTNRYALFAAMAPEKGVQWIQKELADRTDLSREDISYLQAQIDELNTLPKWDKFSMAGKAGFTYKEGWTPRVNKRSEEEKGFKNYWKRAFFNQFTPIDVDYIEHKDDAKELLSGIPLRYLGVGPDSAKNHEALYTFNGEITMSSFLGNMLAKKNLDDVYNIGIGIEEYWKGQDKSTDSKGNKDNITFIQHLMQGIIKQQKKDNFKGRKLTLPNGSSISLDKVISFIRYFTAFGALAFNILGATVTNTAQTLRAVNQAATGSIYKLLNPNASVEYTLKDFATSFAPVGSWFKKRMFNFVGNEKQLENDKLHQMLELTSFRPKSYDLAKGREDFKTTHGWLFGGWLNKLISTDTLIMPYALVDDAIYASYLIGQLKNIKWTDTEGVEHNMWESYEMIDGKLQYTGGVRGIDATTGAKIEGLTSKEIIKMKAFSARDLGPYRPEERTALENQTLGALYMTFKRWLPAVMQRAFTPEFEDESLGHYMQSNTIDVDTGLPVMTWMPEHNEGFMNTVLKHSAHLALYTKDMIGNNPERANSAGWKSLSSAQQQNYIYGLMRLFIVFGMLGLITAIFGDADPEDDNKIKAGAVRAMYDLSFEFVIFNIDQWKSTLLAVPTVTKTLDWTNGIRKLITNGLIPWIVPGMEADIIERGPNKGFPSGLSDVLRTTPYLSTGYGLWQLGTNWKDLEDDLASGRGQ